MEPVELKEYKLGPYHIHSSTNEVEVGGQKVRLTPKEMGVLIILLENRDKTVMRKTLLETVWGNEFGNDNGLTQAISRLRSILSSGQSLNIRTIPKKGYLLHELENHKWSLKNAGLKIKPGTIILVSLILIIGLFIIFRPVRVTIDVRESNGPSEIVPKVGD